MKQFRFILICAALGHLFAQSPSVGQTQTSTLSLNDYRPLSAAALAIEQLSGIPVNYEDVRCDFPSDQIDVTNRNLTPAQRQVAAQSGVTPGKQLIPRGGQLTPSVLVDSISGTLPDASAAASALQQIQLAYKASGSLPGAFRLDNYNGAFFLEPTEMRDATGATVVVTPVLSTPINISVSGRNAAETLELILAQVSKASGFKVNMGAVPMNALAMGRVTLSADSEPASHVLSEFFNILLGYGPNRPVSSPGLAYRLLYDPGLKLYMFNIVEVGVPSGHYAPAQRQTAVAPPSWFTTKKP